MAQVIFWEKPGCPANEKQKRTLEAARHTLEVRDLTTEAFTAESLRTFFGDAPVEDWLNRLHPDVKSRKIDRASITETQALELMLADRELIRRPLMQVGEVKSFGFDPTKLQAWIGIQPSVDGLSCDDRHAQGRCDHGHL